MDKEFLMKVLHLNKMWPLKDWQKDLLILMGLLTLAEELVLKNPICCRWDSAETGISQFQIV